VQVCYHCLKVLPTPQQQAAGAAEMPISSRSHMFCSSSCLSSAQASYYSLESQLSLEQLERHCDVYGEVRQRKQLFGAIAKCLKPMFRGT
jgi:hypothetical protein